MKIPRLELPSGGWVEFNVPDELDTDVYRRVRAQMTGMTRTAGERMGDTYREAELALIAAWSVPYLGQPLPPPVSAPELLGRLKINDTKALDRHLQRPIEFYFLRDDPVDPDLEYGDPSLPVGGSGGSSRETGASEAPETPASSDSPTASGTTAGSDGTPAGDTGQ